MQFDAARVVFLSDAICVCQYATYGEKTRKSLARLNEAIIDYDLVEELISYIHDTQGPGAMLVFMPGIREARALVHPTFAYSELARLNR